MYVLKSKDNLYFHAVTLTKGMAVYSLTKEQRLAIRFEEKTVAQRGVDLGKRSGEELRVVKLVHHKDA